MLFQGVVMKTHWILNSSPTTVKSLALVHAGFFKFSMKGMFTYCDLLVKS
jgi:hypothetical protein